MANKVINQSYLLLVERCNNMLNNKFILSSNDIASVLQLIAAVPCLSNYVAKCSQNFNFKEQYAISINSNIFVLPDSSTKIVAFVTQLLYMFDRKSLDLTKFIKNYFATADFETSYSLFVKAIINPYIIAFKNILIEDEKNNSSVIENGSISDSARNQCMEYIKSLIVNITNDDTLSDEKKEDYLLMLDGFYYSFELSRAKMIKVVWTGLKSVMSSYRTAQSHMLAIEKILQSYAVI